MFALLLYLSDLSRALGLSTFTSSKSILKYLRNKMYGGLLPDFPERGVTGKGERADRRIEGSARDLGA